MTTTSYAVTGLTCGYCIAEVMERVWALAGVTRVAVDLVKDGPSPVLVSSGPAVRIGQVREVLGQAGFDLTGLWTGEREEHAAHVVHSPSSGRRVAQSTTVKGVAS